MKGINTPGQALDPGHIVAHSAPRGGVFHLAFSTLTRKRIHQDGPASLVSFENKQSESDLLLKEK
jgi:hypothetical protein